MDKILEMSQKCVFSAQKASSIGCTKRGMASRARRVIAPLYFVLVRLHFGVLCSGLGPAAQGSFGASGVSRRGPRGCEGEKKGLLLYCPDTASGLKSLYMGSNLPADSPQMQISLPNGIIFSLFFFSVNLGISFPHF